MTRKQQRLGILALAMAALAGATALVLIAFNDNLVFFYSPSELKEKAVAAERRVRIGGLVEAQSLLRSADGQTVSFRVTDGATEIASPARPMPTKLRDTQRPAGSRAASFAARATRAISRCRAWTRSSSTTSPTSGAR